MTPRLLTLSPLGEFFLSDGALHIAASVDDIDVDVPHLQEQILSYSLPKGEKITVKVTFSSHCWTRSYDPNRDEGRTIVYDHKRQRVFCHVRYEASFDLVQLLSGLPNHKIYHASDRNYGAYNATVKARNGHYYTAFFTLNRERGSLEGQRYRYAMRVESAYLDAQLGTHRKVNFAGVIAQVGK